MTLDDVRREVEEQFAGYRGWRSTLRIQFPESTEEVCQRFQHQLEAILACVQRAFQDYAALRQRMNLGEIEDPAQTLRDLLKRDVTSRLQAERGRDWQVYRHELGRRFAFSCGCAECGQDWWTDSPEAKCPNCGNSYRVYRTEGKQKNAEQDAATDRPRD